MAVKTAENRKITKHKPNCDAINVEFLPLIVDAFGRPSETFISFVTNLIHRASDITHIPFSLLLNYWKKRISTNIQRFNARMLMDATHDIYTSGMTSSDFFDDPNFRFL